MYRLILYGGTCVSEDEDENGEPLPYRYVDSESLSTLGELVAGFRPSNGRRWVIVEVASTCLPVAGWQTAYAAWQKWSEQ